MDSLFSFDVSSRIAHFRVEYTTTSALTYHFPTKNSVIGLLGAIGGIKRGYLAGMQKKLKIGIQILSEVRTYITGMNLQYGKGTPLGGMIAVWPSKNLIANYELLLFPKYRIFVKGPINLLKDIVSNIRLGTSYFTPYLGNMFALARIENFREYHDYSEVPCEEKTALSTVVPDSMADILDFSGVYYVRVPLKMNEPQKASAWERIYYKKKPGKIVIRAKGGIYDVGEAVALF